jgi:hypothetical protein
LSATGAAPSRYRDVWTWTTIATDSKLIVSHASGGRDSAYAMALIVPAIPPPLKNNQTKLNELYAQEVLIPQGPTDYPLPVH